MGKSYQRCCPKCNNKAEFYRYGKDVHEHQKYQCKKYWYQWAPDIAELVYIRTKRGPILSSLGKTYFPVP